MPIPQSLARSGRRGLLSLGRHTEAVVAARGLPARCAVSENLYFYEARQEPAAAAGRRPLLSLGACPQPHRARPAGRARARARKPRCLPFPAGAAGRAMGDRRLRRHGHRGRDGPEANPSGGRCAALRPSHSGGEFKSTALELEETGGPRRSNEHNRILERERPHWQDRD